MVLFITAASRLGARTWGDVEREREGPRVLSPLGIPDRREENKQIIPRRNRAGL